MEKVVIIGSGGHAKSVVDSIEAMGCFEIAGFTEKSEFDGEIYRGYKVIGQDLDLEELFKSGIHCAVMGIGFLGMGETRKKLYLSLKKIGFTFPKIIDPSAVIAKDAVIEEGAFIGKRAVVNSNAHIGKLAIVNTGAIVEHDCTVGDFTHIAVSAVLCGMVTVGNECMIGANSTIIQALNIGNNTIVGAGAIITKNVENSVIVKNSLTVEKKVKL